MVRQRVWFWVLVIQYSNIRDDVSVKLARQTLPDEIQAVLKVRLVHLRHTLVLILRLRKIIHNTKEKRNLVNYTHMTCLYAGA